MLFRSIPRAGADDDFGRTLAIAGSGDVFAIGAPGEDGSALGIGGDQLSNAAPDSGAVYAFERPQMTWRQASYVKATNTEAGDAFGRALALSGDGATLLVGAPDEDGGGAGFGGDPDDNSVPGSGALYLY